VFESQDFTAGHLKNEALLLTNQQEQSTHQLLNEAFEHSKKGKVTPLQARLLPRRG
jgi:hypothetical protein